MPGKLSPSTVIEYNDAPTIFPVLKESTEALDTIHPGVSSQSEALPTLLTLPAELRTAIYEAVLLQSESDLNLLGTCHCIYMAAAPMLWQRPASFPSQSKLFSWVERSAQSDLRRVRTLTLRLTDIDLSSLIDTSPRRGHIFSAWTLYQQELEKLNAAIQSLSGVVDLTIIPCDRNGSQLLNGMYLSFLGMVAVQLPRLKQLTVHDSESVLEKVPSLRQLAKVVFDDSRRGSSGSSTSSSSSVAPMSRGKRRGDVAKHEDVVPIKMEICELDQL